MRKSIFSYRAALVALTVCAGFVAASDIYNPTTSTGNNDFFTLNEIYNYLGNGDTQRKLDATGSTSTTTASAPANDTSHTTNEIYPLLQRMPATGQTTVFQAGDDGTYQKGATMRYTYYDDSGNPITTPETPINSEWNNVLTDDNTGLMWIRDHTLVNGGGGGTGGNQDLSGPMTWPTAITRCEALSYAGYSDWRVPNIKELFSIADHGTISPAIDSTAFPNTTGDKYWSSSTYAGGTLFGWYTNFADGHARNDLKTLNYRVRAVRGGQ